MSCREHAFIKNHKEYFGISKRYIKYSEIVEIAERYNLDESVINYEITKGNDLFIKSQILVYLNEFKSFLFSRKLPIEDNAIIQLQSKYNKKYFNYYRELHFDKLIEIWRFLIKESIENGDLIEYQNLLFLDYIDENNHLFLKNKYVKSDFYFNEAIFDEFIDDLNIQIIDLNKNKILKNFKSILSSCNQIIDKEKREKIKSEYNKSYYSFFDELNFNALIDKHNSSIIKSKGQNILNDFNSFLNSYLNFIDEDCYVKLKSKYNTSYSNYFDDFDFDTKIKEHNGTVGSKIIKNALTSEDGKISYSKLIELKSKYESIDWDYIINNYNDALENDLANFKVKSLLNNNEIKFDDSNIDELDETIRNVYYLEDYVRVDYWFKYPDEKETSELILDYKNNNENAIAVFTKKLIEAIVHISNNYISDDIDTIFLISVPPSKIKKNVTNPMRKSINLIKQCYDNDLIECSKKIIDYSNLLYRYKNVKSSHKSKPGERPEKQEHIESIICTKKNFAKENAAYILLDDITTKGTIMYACEDILINNGVNENNIYKLVIAETMWVY